MTSTKIRVSSANNYTLKAKLLSINCCFTFENNQNVALK